MGRGLEDFLFIHLKSPWTAFHGSAVLRGIYKKTHPAQWVGLEDGSAAVGGLGRWVSSVLNTISKDFL